MSALGDAPADAAFVARSGVDLRGDGRSLDLVLRLVALTTACAVAFGPALARLAGRLGTGSPTEFAVLVPFLSVLCAVWLIGRRPDPAVLLPNPAADATVATGLLLAAALSAWWLPQAFGFDTSRLGLDLVGLPFFAAGAAVLLLGGRAVFLARGAVALAVLASPPLLAVVGGWFERAGIAVGWPVVRAVAAGTGADVVSREGLRLVDLGGTLVAVDLACAGASTTLGVLLVAGAVTPVLSGTWRRRLTWLGATAVAALAANAARLALIVLIGDRAGGDVALRLVHPWAGMAVAAIVAMLALLALPRAGLALAGVERPAGRRTRQTMPPRRLWRAAGVVLGVVVVGAGTGAAWETDPLAGRGGQVNLAAIGAVAPAAGSAALDAERVLPLQPVEWAPQFFGPGATWERRLVLLADGVPATVDVVTAGTDGAFDAYGLVACYASHGEVLEQASGDVGLEDRAGVWLRYTTPGRVEESRLLSWRSRLADGRVQRVVVAALADPSDREASRAADEAVLQLGSAIATRTTATLHAATAP